MVPPPPAASLRVQKLTFPSTLPSRSWPFPGRMLRCCPPPGTACRWSGKTGPCPTGMLRRPVRSPRSWPGVGELADTAGVRPNGQPVRARVCPRVRRAWLLSAGRRFPGRRIAATPLARRAGQLRRASKRHKAPRPCAQGPSSRAADFRRLAGGLANSSLVACRFSAALGRPRRPPPV